MLQKSSATLEVDRRTAPRSFGLSSSPQRFLNNGSSSSGKTEAIRTPTKDSGSREQDERLTSNGAVPAWNPPSLQRRHGIPTEEDRLETLRRTVRSALNKLTPENFEKVTADIVQLVLKNEIILSSVIELIFRKALEEPQYNSLYAQLCRQLSNKSPNQENFRKVLLTEVQDAYVLRTASGVPSRRQKQEHLSNIKFIGELGKLDLLHERILHHCIQELFARVKATSVEEKIEDLECLCQMIRIVGKVLDSTSEGKNLMDSYISQLKRCSEDAELPSRIRFLCMDVVELRSNKWIPRRIHQANAPKTITEIRDEIRAEIGAAATEAMLADFDQSVRLSPNRGGYQAKSIGGPRTATEKKQQNQQDGNRYGNAFGNQQRLGNGDANVNNSKSWSAPKQTAFSSTTNRADGKKTLKILNPESHVGTEAIALRPSTSLVPQRLSKTAEVARNVKDHMSVASLAGSRPVSSPVTTIHETHDKAKAAKNQQSMNKNELMNALGAVLTAYFDGAKDRPAAVQNIKDLPAPKRFKSDLVSHMLQVGMESGEQGREKVSELIAHLTCETWVTEEDVREGFDRLLEKLDSGFCDPKPCMAASLVDLVMSQILTLRTAMNLLSHGHHFPLVLLFLQRLEQFKGAEFISESLAAEKIDILKCIPEKELKLGVDHIVDTLNQYGLLYLCPSFRLQAQLSKLLSVDTSHDEICRFLAENAALEVEANSSFVFSVFSSIVKHIHYRSVTVDGKAGDGPDSCRVNEEKFRKNIVAYKDLFASYLSSSDNQLLALYAVQSFYHSIGFPKGWILCWFCVLHEFDIVEPDVFNAWRDEVNDLYPGKGKALFQVNAWLEWMNSIESDSEEDDGDYQTVNVH